MNDPESVPRWMDAPFTAWCARMREHEDHPHDNGHWLALLLITEREMHGGTNPYPVDRWIREALTTDARTCMLAIKSLQTWAAGLPPTDPDEHGKMAETEEEYVEDWRELHTTPVFETADEDVPEGHLPRIIGVKEEPEIVTEAEALASIADNRITCEAALERLMQAMQEFGSGGGKGPGA